MAWRFTPFNRLDVLDEATITSSISVVHRICRETSTGPQPIVAVTGTNGKTSVASFLRQIWSGLGYNAVSIGSEGHIRSQSRMPFLALPPTTAPFERYLETHVDVESERIVFEATSDGLEESAYIGVELRAAAFTNLSRDHLDVHGSMEEYFDAKRRLFEEALEDGISVINVDDEYGRILAHQVEAANRPLIRVGLQGDGDVRLEAANAQGTLCRIIAFEEHRMAEIPFATAIEQSNLLVSIALAIACGDALQDIVREVPRLEAVAGRLEYVGETHGGRILLDFAHNAGGLTAVLEAVRATTEGRLRVLFGCGGDRDPGKRPEMGLVACALADDVIVTDDNPRNEDAASIRAAILAGCSGAREIADRRTAIRVAVTEMEAGDTLIVAGRGDEATQRIAGTDISLNDREAILAAMAAVDSPAEDMP